MKKHVAKIILLGLMAMGCEASIGDKCTTSNDCPTGTVCDTDSPGGYCLVSGCEADEECPEEAACIFYTKSLKYCLKKCSKDGDCRDGYKCRDDIGAHKFCYVQAEGVYGREDGNRLPYTPPSENEAPEQPAE